MENAADALIMAAQVLMFTIALTVCMSSFSNLRSGIDNVLGRTEILDMKKDGEQYINYIQGKNDDDKLIRVVGIETVIESLYRAIKEDYVIYMIFNDSSIYSAVETYDGVSIEITTNPEKNDKIQALKFTIGKRANNINQDVNWILSKGFYDKIKNMQFYEYLGEYQEATGAGVTSDNKMTNRIITFKQK